VVVVGGPADAREALADEGVDEADVLAALETVGRALDAAIKAP
jgi:hypothetical protein